jgi:hypothetical protein
MANAVIGRADSQIKTAAAEGLDPAFVLKRDIFRLTSNH